MGVWVPGERNVAIEPLCSGDEIKLCVLGFVKVVASLVARWLKIRNMLLNEFGRYLGVGSTAGQ